MSDISFSKLTWENLPERTTALSATNLNRIENGINDSVNGVNSNSHSIAELQTRISQIASGTPKPVNTIAEMTDHSKIYVYTGSEQGESTGYWYSYDSTQEKFVPRGTYGGAVTDTTLALPNVPADSETVGLALADKADADDLDAIDDRVTALEEDDSGSGIKVVSTVAQMVDTSAVYIYNGTETGYTAGHWYFYNTGTSAWTDGGQYTGWETVDTALENFLDENAQEMGALTVIVGSTTYTYNGSANVSITLPTYNGSVS